MFDDISPDDLEYVGKKAGRPDMVEKLTGEATFVSDMELPGMLHVQLKNRITSYNVCYTKLLRHMLKFTIHIYQNFSRRYLS